MLQLHDYRNTNRGNGIGGVTDANQKWGRIYDVCNPRFLVAPLYGRSAPMAMVKEKVREILMRGDNNERNR